MEFSDFLNCYRKIQENDDDNNHKKRQLLSCLYSGALKSLDETSTNYLLESRLKTYNNTEGGSFESDVQSSIDNLLKQNNKQFPPAFKSELHKVDVKSLINLPESCKNDSLNCLKTTNFSESEFQQFKQSLMRNKPELPELKPNLIAKSFAPRTCNRDLKPVKIQNNSDEQSSVNTNCNFRTAKEELQAQNVKKYGNFGVSAGNQGGHKRKLGIHRKFVSPLLSNKSDDTPDAQSSSNNSEEWPNEVDDRLKNIDPKMVELIKSEIMDVNSSVEWDDIAGLEFAKTAIQEAVIWPLLRPDIFTGLRRPPKGILLFGPPGTGKTLIGKCVASQSKSTFFSISASSLTSKWIGEGEKMVRTLFAVARCYQPAVIFIDEIDSLLSQRSETEHESSRRIKTEFLVQLDGATTDNDERILLIGATNRPQELDEAARRRFVKRLYIPLPKYEARLQLINKLISNEKHNLSQDDFVKIAQMSDGYSGADIRNLCSEASLGPIRAIDMRMIERIEAAQVRPLLMEDFVKAFTRIRSSVATGDLHHYIAWDKTYGSGL